MRFIGRREGLPDELVEQMSWAESLTKGNSRITLFVAFNYGGRAEIVDAARRFKEGDEEDFRELPLRARDARPGPHHPHLGRAAALQLPALAVRLLGARLPRRAVAGFHTAGARAVARGVPRASASLRRPMSTARARRKERRNQRSETTARAAHGAARDRGRAVPRDRGRGDLHRGRVHRRLPRDARALRDVRPRAARAAGGLRWRSRACSSRRYTAARRRCSS